MRRSAERDRATWSARVRQLVLGRAADRSSVVRLQDPEGRDRIVMEVAADRVPSLKILDADGKIIDQLPCASPGK
jgi:hypothetical protein